MSAVVTSQAGDRVGYDDRGEGPVLIFVADAGQWPAIDAKTDRTTELLTAQGGADHRLRRGRAGSQRWSTASMAGEVTVFVGSVLP